MISGGTNQQLTSPTFGITVTVDLPEVKIVSISLIVVNSAHVLQKYSSYLKLCRVLAYCRFMHNRTSHKETGSFESEELMKAEKTIARWVQTEVFLIELCCLKNQYNLPKKSLLVALKPFLDQDRLIRVLNMPKSLLVKSIRLFYRQNTMSFTLLCGAGFNIIHRNSFYIL